MRWIATFITEAWALIAPFWRSEERWRARLLLGVVIALNLSLVGMTVLLTYWQRAFYNTLESKDWDGFIALRAQLKLLLPVRILFTEITFTNIEVHAFFTTSRYKFKFLGND